MNKVSITHMSNAHTDWLRGLDFYREEVNILKTRLTEIAGKNTNKDIQKEIGHFESQFDIQTENIHKLSHDIQANVKLAGREFLNSGAGYIDGALFEQHTELGKRYLAEEKTVSELKQAFYHFASPLM
jgi:L-arabinose isomerase